MPAPRNRYVMSVLLSLEEGGSAREQQRPVAELATLTLREYLDAHADRDGRPGNEVLIFDQFEEVLTADPTDEPAKHEFFRELGQVLRDRGHWALFSMREDFLAALDPYLPHLPTRLRTTYRLDLLSVHAGARGDAPPGRADGRRLHRGGRPAAGGRPPARTRAAAERGSPRSSAPTSSRSSCRSPATCCGRCCRRTPREITQADVEALGGVDQALAGLLRRPGRAFAAEQTGVPERAIRDWFEEHLITPQGLRSQVLEGPEAADRAGHRVLGRAPRRPPRPRGDAPAGDLVRAGARPADRTGPAGQRRLARRAPLVLRACGRAVGAGGQAGSPAPARRRPRRRRAGRRRPDGRPHAPAAGVPRGVASGRRAGPQGAADRGGAASLGSATPHSGRRHDPPRRRGSVLPLPVA